MNSTDTSQIDQRLSQLEDILKAVQQRNARVEIDKKWEVSLSRRLAICILTYLFVAIFLSFTGVKDFLLAALVPVAGFMLSQLSLNQIKAYWQKFNS